MEALLEPEVVPIAIGSTMAWRLPTARLAAQIDIERIFFDGFVLLTDFPIFALPF